MTKSTANSSAIQGPLTIFFDELGQQIQAQQQYGNRLDGPTGLFTTLHDAQWSHTIGGITTAELADADVLVLTNRVTQGYSLDELEVIVDFVRGGKGLWCMSNHAPFNADTSGSQMNNHVRYDSAVATTFLTSYQAAAYQGTGSSPVPLAGSNLTLHPIIQGSSGWPAVTTGQPTAISSVVTRSFCGVLQNYFTSTIAGLQSLDGVCNYQDQAPVSEGMVWAVSLDGIDVTGSGRVVIGADAGWLGNTNSSWPGPGEFQNGDNRQFALNTLSWLAQLS